MVRRFAVGCFIVAIAGTLAVSRTPSAGAQSLSVAGAWVLSTIHLEGEDVRTWEGPSLIIFTEDGYYSHFQAGPDHVAVAAGTPGSELTDEQRLAAFQSMAAHSGTYTVDGDTVTRHAYVRKSPVALDFPNNGSPFRTTVDGDTMTVYGANNENNYTVYKRANLR